MTATGPYLSNKTIFKQKYCLGKKWEQFQCGDTDPEFCFFSRKLRLEGGGVSCFSRDFEIYCLNCPKSAEIGQNGPRAPGVQPHCNCSHFFPRQYFCLKSFLFERYGPVAFISGVFDAPTRSGYAPAPENHPIPLVEKIPTSAHKFRYSIQQENIREAKKSRKIENFSKKKTFLEMKSRRN